MKFVQEILIPRPVEEVFRFHERPEAFRLLQPPWETMEIFQLPESLEVGTQVRLRTRVGPLWVDILAEHVAYKRNVYFEDVMLKGPFAKWHHKHIFQEHADGCLLRDEVDYEPPLGVLGRIGDPLVIRPRLKRLFKFRHEVTCSEVLKSTEQI